MPRNPAHIAVLLVAAGTLLLAVCAPPHRALTPAEGVAAGYPAAGHQYLVTPEAKDGARHRLTTLAADDMEGREAASEGERRAGAFIATELERLGVHPGGDLVDEQRTYFQAVPLRTARFDLAHTRFALDSGLVGELGDDWIAIPGSAPDRDLRGRDLVFVGYGLTAPGHDDYEGLDVREKVVLVAPGHPVGVDSIALPQGTLPANSFLPKYVNALQHGAAAVLVVAAREGMLLADWEVYRASVLGTAMALAETPRQTSPAPFLFLHPDFAGRLLDAAGAPPGLIEQAEASGPVTPFVTERTVDLTLALELGVAEARNVVGVLPGDDRPGEYVAFGAHYDHLGTVDGEVYNGADDNASGVAALLAIAEAFAVDRAAGDIADRSALFVFHTVEEKGLQGSEFFAAHPERSVVADLDRVVAQINIDMVGREHPDSLYVVGASRLSADFGRTVEAVNAALGEERRPLFEFNRAYDDPDDPENIYERSDHYSYAKRGVPIVFFTDGMGANWGKGSPADHYHRPNDDPALIDIGKVVRTARLAYAIGRETADAPERPEVDGATAPAP